MRSRSTFFSDVVAATSVMWPDTSISTSGRSCSWKTSLTRYAVPSGANLRERGLSNIQSLSFVAWNGNSFESKMLSSFWQSDSILRSPLVAGMFFDFQEVYFVRESCYQENNLSLLLSGSCTYDIKQTKAAKPFKICSIQNYSYDSLESAALSVAGAVDRVYDYLNLALPNLTIAPVNILLLPDIQIDRGAQVVSKSVSDNAAWILPRPNARLNAYIMIYPASLQYRSTGRPPFWQVPWIVTHSTGTISFMS